MLKLNPNLFKDCKPSDMVGDLGYPAFFQYMGFKEIRSEIDEYRGEIVFCTINRIDKKFYDIMGLKSIYFEGELVLLRKDLMNGFN